MALGTRHFRAEGCSAKPDFALAGAVEAARPTQARSKPGGSQSNHPAAIVAAAAERKILEVLRSSPGMGTAELARATDSKVNTTAQRLQRLRARELVQGGGEDWRASA